MKKIDEKEIRNLKVRFDKQDLDKQNTLSIIRDLYHTCLRLFEENNFLKDTVNSISHDLPAEKQWQNILSTQLELGLLSQEKSRDFLEITNSINNQVYTVTIQRKFGNTPNQLLKKSEIRRLKASEKIVNLKKEIRELKECINSHKLRIDRLLLTQERFPIASLEELNITKEKIIEAYKFLQSTANRYNVRAQAYQVRVRDVPRSVMDSLHEAWAIASKEINHTLRLQKEITQLKVKLAQLKRQCVLSNKKRTTY